MKNIMNKKIQRIYVDTTVVLGHFDIDATRRQETDVFWDAVRKGQVIAVVSNVLDEETKSKHAREFLAELPKSQIERIVSTDESEALAKQYVTAKVVTERALNDCRHIAIAAIYADGVVSWNMNDMVNRHEKYNSVSMKQGYRRIKIVTPNKYKEICNET